MRSKIYCSLVLPSSKEIAGVYGAKEKRIRLTLYPPDCLHGLLTLLLGFLMLHSFCLSLLLRLL